MSSDLLLQSTKGSEGLWWNFYGVQGTYELLIILDKTTIWRFLFKRS